MEYLKEFGTIVAILGGIAGISMSLHSYLSNKLSNSIKEYEIYKEVSLLLDNDCSSENLASIHVALSCIISRELSVDEIKWFIKTPCAFKYIKDFSTQVNYLEISENNLGFSFKDKYKFKKSRVLEILKLLGLYMVLGSTAAVIFIYGQLTQLQTPLLILLYGFGAVSGFLAVICLKLGITFTDSTRIIKKVVFKEMPES